MRLQQWLLGSVLGTIDQVIRAIAVLIVTPVMVSALGVTDFGIWVLLTGLFAQFVLFDPGLQSSLPRFLIHQDPKVLRSLASTAQAMFVVVTIVAGLATVAVWLVLPQFFSDGERLETARSIALMLGAANMTCLATRLPGLYLQSLMRRDLISIIAIARVLVCSGAVLWLLMVRGAGLVEVALVHSVGACVEAFALVYCGRSLLASIRWRWVNRAAAKSMLSFSGWAYLISICERLRFGLDGFVLGWVKGSEGAGIYSLGARPVFMVFDSVYACIGTQLLPAFSRLSETGDSTRLESAFLAITRISAYLSVVSAGLLMLLGPSFMRWWIPGQAMDTIPVMLCLALPLALQVAQVPAVQLLYAVAEQRVLALIQTVGLVLNIALSIGFAYWLGIVGAALGTAVEILLLHLFFMPLVISKKAKIAPGRFLWNAQLVPLLVCVAVFAMPQMMVLKWMPPQPTIWHLVCAATGMFVWLGAWAGIFRIGRKEIEEFGRVL
jgi:O-antigen/teichoic acid export membrane protein